VRHVRHGVVKVGVRLLNLSNALLELRVLLLLSRLGLASRHAPVHHGVDIFFRLLLWRLLPGLTRGRWGLATNALELLEQQRVLALETVYFPLVAALAPVLLLRPLGP
jgi:hypothetical protein